MRIISFCLLFLHAFLGGFIRFLFVGTKEVKMMSYKLSRLQYFTIKNTAWIIWNSVFIFVAFYTAFQAMNFPVFSQAVRVQNVVWKTCRERWVREREREREKREREPGKSMPQMGRWERMGKKLMSNVSVFTLLLGQVTGFFLLSKWLNSVIRNVSMKKMWTEEKKISWS